MSIFRLGHLIGFGNVNDNFMNAVILNAMTTIPHKKREQLKSFKDTQTHKEKLIVRVTMCQDQGAFTKNL